MRSTSDRVREVVGSSPAGHGQPRSNRGQLLFAPRAWAYSSKWVPATAGKVKGRYVRRCLVRAMYLSASVVALSTWGAITKVELYIFTFYQACQPLTTGEEGVARPEPVLVLNMTGKRNSVLRSKSLKRLLLSYISICKCDAINCKTRRCTCGYRSAGGSVYAA